MRCLTLAGQLRERGDNVVFVCRPRSGDLINFIREKGFQVKELSPAPPDDDGFTLGGPPEEEISVISALCQEIRSGSDHGGKEWPVLIIDHYAIDAGYETALRHCVSQIMVIDDLENRPHNCDILLDQNFSLKQERYKGLVPDHCELRLGPSYALLRSEFPEMQKKILSAERPEFDIKKVFVFFGGSDPDNYTGRALKILRECGSFAPEVVIGAGHPVKDEIKKITDSMPGSQLHIQTNEMASVMAGCSWYLGAGGSVTWERMSLGLTGITIIIAENQRAIVEDLEAAGYLIRADLENLKEKILSLDPEILRAMGRDCMKLSRNY